MQLSITEEFNCILCRIKISMPLLTKPTGEADVSAAIMEIKMSDAQSGGGTQTVSGVDPTNLSLRGCVNFHF